MTKKQTAKSSILPDSTFIPVDLFAHCVWDEDLGTMVTIQGVSKLLEELKESMKEGWKYEEMEVNESDDTLFLLKLSRQSAEKLGTCST